MNGWPKDCLVRPRFFFFYLLTQSLGGPDVVGGARVEAQEALQRPGSVNRCIRVVTEHVLGLFEIRYRFSFYLYPRVPCALSSTSTDYMRTRCFCDSCHGALVSLQTRLNHQRKQLKNKTVSEQFQREREVLQHSAGASSSSLASPAHLHPDLPSGVLAPSGPSLDVTGPYGTSDDAISLAHASTSVSDLDGFTNTNVIYDPAWNLSSAIDVNPEYVDVHEGEYVHKDDVEFPDEDALFDNADLGDQGADSGIYIRPFISDPSIEDSPEALDPFVVDPRDRQGTTNFQELEIPTHLLSVYALIIWLHLQFHLPHAACNAVLAFLALLFRFFKLDIMPPLITLQSATRALGVDPGIELLAVCPQCRGVYPSSSSRHMKDECTFCHIPLFLPDHTRQGNRRAVKTPIIKYPYRPLSTQIVSILKNPGVEALLDDWRSKPRNSGEYGDIFDGRVCKLKLSAPDGSLFFSNRPQDISGPDNELRIGVNLGVDWCVRFFFFV